VTFHTVQEMQIAAVEMRKAFAKLINCAIEDGKTGERGWKHIKVQTGAYNSFVSSIESEELEPATAKTNGTGKKDLNATTATPDSLQKLSNRANLHVCKHLFSYSCRRGVFDDIYIQACTTLPTYSSLLPSGIGTF
jgi:hypothetical protein